jgi:hypothetical protein
MFIFYGGAEYWKQMDQVVQTLSGVANQLDKVTKTDLIAGG